MSAGVSGFSCAMSQLCKCCALLHTGGPLHKAIKKIKIYDLMACEFFVVGWGLKNRKTIKEQNIFLT